MANTINKDALVREIRKGTKIISARLQGHPIPQSKACLYAAFTATTLLQRHFKSVVPQAGTMMWYCAKEDDGVRNTHFSYMWEPYSLASIFAARMGFLPEMHCWVAILDNPKKPVIVDVQTKYFKEESQAVYPKVIWDGADPPDYFWGTPTDLERLNCKYIANEEAIMLMHKAMGDLLKKACK